MDSKLLLHIVLNEFDGIELAGFDDRLTLQKRIYLLQSFGLNLDYHYHWYVRGPYCPQLTKDAFEATARSKDLHLESQAFDLTDGSKNMIKAYQGFENQLGRHALPLLLELAASIHYLLHVGFLPGEKSYENIRTALRERGKQFTDDQYGSAWSALNSYGLVENETVA